MSHDTHASMKRQGMRDHAAKLAVRAVGAVKSAVAAGVHAHEKHDHPGKPLTKMKEGGHVDGMKMEKRLDRATGGRTKHSGKKPSHTVVNVNLPQNDSHPMPIPVPAGGGAPMPPPRPPMVPPAPGGVPMGGAPGAPAMGGPPHPPMAPPPGGPPVGAGVPMMRKSGGRIRDLTDDAGSGGGLGRLAKMKNYKKVPMDAEDKPAVDPGAMK